MPDNFIDLNISTALEFGGNYTTAGNVYNYATKRGITTKQTAVAVDALSEGPIYGLVDGPSSVLLNGVPIMDPIMKVEYGALTSKDVSYVASTRTVTDNTGELFKNKNTAHGTFTIQISGALKTGSISTTADSTVITSSSAFFTSDMAPGYLKGLGATITIPGAGPDGAPAIGFIKSVESSTQAILATPVAKTVSNASVKLDLVATISSITGNTAVLSGTGTLGINVSNVSSQISVPLITNINTTPKWNFKDAGFAFRAGTRDQSHLMLPGATGSGTVFKSGATLNSTDYNAINYNGSPIFPNDYLTAGVGGDGKWSRIEQPSANRMTFTSDSMSIPNPNEVDKIKINILFPSGLLAVKPKDGDERDGFCEFQILFEYSQTGNFDDTVTKTMFGLSDEALSIRAPINNDDNDNFGGYAGYHVNTGTVENKTKSKFIKTFEFDVAQFQPFTKYRIVIGKVTPTNGFGARRYWYNSTVIQSVENIITDKFTYPYTAYAATAFSAEDFQTPPKRGFEIRGLQVKVPTNYFARHELAEGQAASYTRNVSGNTVTNSSNYVDWDGTFRGDIKTYTDPLSPNYAPVWTDNPVWILLDVLTNDRYGLGKFVDPDDDFKYIDKYQLFQIAKYCDELVPDGKGGLEPRFTANLYLTKLQEAQKVIKDLLSIFRGLLIWFDGKFAPSVNAYKSPVYTFTKGNIEGGVFKYQSSAKKFRANQIRVTWNNPDNLYQQDVEIVEDTQNIIETGKIISKDVSATGCTSSGQAHRYGKWFILTEKLEKEVVTFNTSLNAATLRPGDVIEVQDADINEVRYSGRVSSTGTRSTSIIPLDGEALTLDTSNYAYKLNLIYPSGGAYLAQETATIDSTTYNLGDLVLTDESGSSIDTLAKASNVKDDSGNLVQLHWSDQVRVETQDISSYTSGAVTVSSAFSAVPDAEVIWSITSTATATGVEQADVSPKEYIIIKTEEKEKNIVTISAVEYADKKFELVDRGYTIDVVPDDLKSPIRTELVNPPRNLTLSMSPTSLSSARMGYRRQDDILVSWEAPENIKNKVTSTVNGAVSNSTSVTIDDFDENIEVGMIAESSAITSLITVSAINGKVITLSSAVTLANDATITFRKDVPDSSITGYEVRVYGGHKRFVSKSDFNHGYTLYTVGADQTSLTIEDVDPSIYTVHVRAVNSIQNYSRFITRTIRVTLRRIIQPSPADKEGTLEKGGTLNQALNLNSSTVEIANTSSSKSYTFEHSSGRVLENTSTTAQTYQQDFNGMGANATAYLLLDGSEFLDSDNEVDATKTTDKLKAVQLVEDDTAVDEQGNKLNFEYWKTVGAANNGLTTISSATVSLDGAVVTGTNTSFTTNFEEGDPIIIGTGVNAFYAIINIINSDTEVEIDRVSSKTYSGAAVAKLSFVPDLEQDQLLAKVTTDGSTNYTLAETYVKTSADVSNTGSTIVSGNRIIEGSISSSNFAGTGDGSAFATTGTKINLNDGSIASEDFRIDSSGNAAFRGDISAASGTLSNSIQIGSGENVFKADSNGIYLGNETFANAEFRVTPAGALTATSADIKGDLETDNLIVTGNAGIHGEVRATSLTAGTVTVASINQEVWNEIDARTAPTQNGFYDNYDSTSTGDYYNGVDTTFELLGTGGNGYLSNGQSISIRTSMVHGYGQQGSQTYTGDALKANFQFQYKALPNGSWTNFGDEYEGITSVYSIPNGFFYELDADPDASVSLSNGVYYQFRLRVFPEVTTNVWADSDANDLFAIEFAIQQSSTGTGSGTGTVTSVASGDGLTGGPITGSGTLEVDSTVVRTSGTQTIAGDKTFSDDIIISGNLDVRGTTTTLDTATLNVEDNNITLNYSTGDSTATANGAGITIQDAVNSTTDATILWDTTNDEFDFSHPITSSGITSTGSVAAAGTVSGQALSVSSSGYGSLELGGVSGAFIDLKRPNTDDFDLRLITTGTGGQIVAPSGATIDMQIVSGTNILSVSNTGINVTGNIVVSGTVDGRDVATDGSKLDGIEAGATTDQTQSEINALGITAIGLSGSPNITVGTVSSGAISTSANLDMNGNNIIDIEQINGTGGTGWLDFNMDTDNIYPTGTTDNLTVLGSITHHAFVGDSNGNGTGGNFYWGYGADKDDGGTFTETMALTRAGDLTVQGNIISETSTGNHGIKVITGNNAEGFIIFGDAQDNSMGGMAYNNSTNSLDIDCNNGVALSFNSDRNATFSGSVQATSFSDGTISGITFVDEDNMASNSATKVPTQQSVKAYVDANTSSTTINNNADNRIITGSGTANTLEAETNLTFKGTSGYTDLKINGSSLGGVEPALILDDTGSGNYESTLILTAAPSASTFISKSGTTNGTFKFQGDNGTTITTYGGFDASGNFEIGTTDIIDASRNMSNIGTISSGAITSSGIVTSQGDAALNDAQIGRLNFTNTNSNASANPIRASIFAGRQNSAWGGYLSFFTSTGTSAVSEVGRFDESGNLLVGKTSADDFSSAGVQIEPAGQITTSIASDTSLRLNRGGTDGTIIELNKAGATVGNIGVSSSTKLYVGAGDSAVRFDPDNNAIRPHNASTNGSTDAVLDLGVSSNRFKDLHLSGTISSGAINTTGNITITSTYPKLSFVDTDNNPDISIIGGSGQIGFYDETNSEYVYQYISGEHNFNTKNLTNIGTISSGAITSTGAIEGTSFSDGTISGITFVDEDNMASNSATKVPTQQSVKAYVDANAGSGTTINNNADNRVITGSGTANTLEAETNVFVNGGKFSVGTTNNTAPVSLDSQITVGSTTANDIVGYAMNVIDGGSNHRAHLFLDDLNGTFGLTSASSVGNLAFVIKQASTEFLRIDTSGDSTFSGNISLGDNKKVVFGTGSDFDAYYNGTNLRIEGAGDLQVGASTGFNFSTGYGTGAQTYMEGDYSNGVKLNQGGATKLQTVSGGVNVTGTLNATGDVVAYYSSDERLKDNITVIDSALNKVTQIRGVEFDWNNKQNTYEGHDIGVIAQEVEKVVPELVKDRDDGYKAVDYQKLTALLIEAVKELKEEVEELKSKLQQ